LRTDALSAAPAAPERPGAGARALAAPRVKICGVTVPAEAAACAAAGAWAVGVVLAESARRVSLARAAEVLGALPAGVARVGVFVDPRPSELAEAASALALDYVQVHGEVDVDAARTAAGVPVILGIRLDGPAAVERARASAAELVLIDASVPGRHGGTGVLADWSLLEAAPLERPFALAGGLTPANVGEGVARLRPAVVDVSSGVERAPGHKDLALVAAFVAAARAGTEASR
jgi:phosphoribosylanthranilate isomerase